VQTAHVGVESIFREGILWEGSAAARAREGNRSTAAKEQNKISISDRTLLLVLAFLHREQKYLGKNHIDGIQNTAL
jgi:hypothetical protein